MKPWKNLLTDYWTSYFKLYPEITEGCTVEQAVTDSLHMGYEVFCDWNEITTDEFWKVINGTRSDASEVRLGISPNGI